MAWDGSFLYIASTPALLCVFFVIVLVVVFAPKAFRKMVVLTLQTAKKAQNIALENTTAEREPKKTLAF